MLITISAINDQATVQADGISMLSLNVQPVVPQARDENNMA